MSRTAKGSKGPGYEFWSRRPGNKYGGAIGRYAKTLTHSRERQMGKPSMAACRECLNGDMFLCDGEGIA